MATAAHFIVFNREFSEDEDYALIMSHPDANFATENAAWAAGDPGGILKLTVNQSLGNALPEGTAIEITLPDGV